MLLFGVLIAFGVVMFWAPISFAWMKKHCNLMENEVFCENAGLSDDNIEELFHMLSENMSFLSLNRNDFHFFPTGDVKRKFIYLETLQISENYLETIPLNLSSIFPNLNQLDLARNGIRKVYLNNFNGMSTLQVLKLQGNKIGSLQSSVFQHLTNLKRLELQMNELDGWWYPAFVSSTFEGLDNLTYLDLRYNDIYRLTYAVFRHLRHPERHINLAWNSIREVHESEFDSEVHTMKKLDLSHNRIQKIGKYAFQGLIFTDQNIGLDLSHNNLRVIADGLLNVKEANISLLDNQKLRYTWCDHKLYYKSEAIQLLLPNVTSLDGNGNCPGCEINVTLGENCRCVDKMRFGICWNETGNITGSGSGIRTGTYQNCSCDGEQVSWKHKKIHHINSVGVNTHSNTTSSLTIVVIICVSLFTLTAIVVFSYYVYKKYTNQRNRV